MRLFSFAPMLLFAATSVALAQSNLQSVLKNDADLRPLIDFDTPPSNEVVAPVTSQLKKSPSLAAPANARTVEEIPVSTPQPIQSVSKPKQPPADFAPPEPTRTFKSNSDPLFDLGVMTTDQGVDPLDPKSGPRVRGVLVDSPAARAGIRAGDQIVALGSTATKSSGELAAILDVKTGVSDRLQLTVYRNGQRSVMNIDTATNTPAAPPIVSTPATSTVQPARFLRPQTGPSSILRRRVPARTVSTQPGQLARPVGQPAPPSPIRVNATQLQPTRQSIVSRQNANAQAVPVRQSPATGQVLRQTQPQRVFVQGPQGVRTVQQRVGVAPRQMQPQRPVVGSNGRLIGNGRLINSALRVLGR